MTDTASLVLAGFRACYHDILFCLTEVEGLPENDPVVVGVRQHLDERFRQMCAEVLLEKLSSSDCETPFANSKDPASDCGSRSDAVADDPLPTLTGLLGSSDLLALATELLRTFDSDEEEPGSDDALSDGNWSDEEGMDDDLASEP